MCSSCVSILNISKTFGKHEVLKNINLEIQRGEIFGLLGPSGAGKTTLVKQLAGLDVPTAGEIHIFQERMPTLQLVEKLGYMAQSDALYTELTAKENLAFFAALYGLKRKLRQQRIKDVMELVQLAEHVDKPVGNYSGGMKRRLSLAISMLHRPELYLLDEPTVGIDPVLRKNVWKAFEMLRNEGKTLIVTTHVMDEAEKCDRLGLMRDGRLIAVGTPAELKKETKTNSIEEAFLVYGGGIS